MPTIKELNNQGTAEYKKGNFETAVHIFENAVKQYEQNTQLSAAPDVARLHYNLSCAKSHLNEYGSAYNHLVEATNYVIVSLGCGKAQEFYALWLFLGDKLFNKIKFTGIDINEDDIKSLNGVAHSHTEQTITCSCLAGCA